MNATLSSSKVVYIFISIALIVTIILSMIVYKKDKEIVIPFGILLLICVFRICRDIKTEKYSTEVVGTILLSILFFHYTILYKCNQV